MLQTDPRATTTELNFRLGRTPSHSVPEPAEERPRIVICGTLQHRRHQGPTHLGNPDRRLSKNCGHVAISKWPREHCIFWPGLPSPAEPNKGKLSSRV